MSAKLDAYAAQWSQMRAGLTQAGGDLARSAIADIGDSYQEILLADASIGPPDGFGTMETEAHEMERVQDPSALESDPAPESAPDLRPSDAELDAAL
jgi:hypothetical protein